MGIRLLFSYLHSKRSRNSCQEAGWVSVQVARIKYVNSGNNQVAAHFLLSLPSKASEVL